jgi:hypothetical protein
MPTIPSKQLCIIHCRVSSAKQAHEGESLDVQERVCRSIASERGWTLAHEPWKESFSGRKTRPTFAAILAFLDDHPSHVQYYLFRSIDRFTRGGSLAYEGMKRDLALRGVEMVDTFGIIQPVRNTLEDVGFEYEWSKASPSEIAEIVVAAAAKQEVTTILTRLIGQEIRLVQRGYKLRSASDGYVNAKIVVGGHKRTIQQPDPERAHYLVQMFALRASGQYTDKQICDRLNAMGYRTPIFKRWNRSHDEVIGQSGGGLLNLERLQALIRRPIYCGVVCEKWTRWQPVRAPYEGLVSLDTFNAANRGIVEIHELPQGRLEIRHAGDAPASGTRQHQRNPLFPYRGVLACSVCRRPLWASSPRGRSGQRFPTYHCARRHAYVGIPKKQIEDVLEEFIAKLRFHPKASDRIRAALIRLYQERLDEIQERADAVDRSVEELELSKASALKAFKLATTDLVRRSMEIEAQEFEDRIKSAHTVSERTAVSEGDIDAFVHDANMTLEHPSVLLKTHENAAQMKALYSVIFEEFPTYEELASGTAKYSLFVRLSSPSETDESTYVRLRQIGWNAIEQIILRWKQDAPLIRAALSAMSPMS